MTTKFTPLEIEIITDRPEECIVECSCQFYENDMIKKYGDSKMVLDDCISGSTMDRCDDVSPQYGGKVAATARRLIDKLEKLGVKFSWAERWY